MTPRTLFDKVWDEHVVTDFGDGRALLHIDRILLHDLSGRAALGTLRERGAKPRDPSMAMATPDHAVSTDRALRHDASLAGTALVNGLRDNARHFGIRFYDVDDPGMGIVHIIGPEQGFTLPGSMLICGDSHTCTHGGLGAFAFGVGRSELVHALITQTLYQRKPKRMRANFEGDLGAGVTAKDMILYLIGQIGTGGGDGYAVEYAGSAIRSLPVEARMTLCNLSIEMGAKIGMVAPDESTFEYVKGRLFAPKGAEWDQAVTYWRTLATDDGATFDREVTIDCARIAPQITWGNSPQDVVAIDGIVPDPDGEADTVRREAMQAALDYMGLRAGQKIQGVKVDWVFIGSCTNSRISDLRAAAAVARGKKVASGVKAWVVPGSHAVKAQAEREGIDRVFKDAGFDWREPGCSLCLASNGETVPRGERSVSTSNRNFVGRQGPGARTHLASPAMAAAAAIAGCIADVRDFGA